MQVFLVYNKIKNYSKLNKEVRISCSVTEELLQWL